MEFTENQQSGIYIFFIVVYPPSKTIIDTSITQLLPFVIKSNDHVFIKIKNLSFSTKNMVTYSPFSRSVIVIFV